MVSTIGGMNSSSMIPFLDFDAIRAHPKVICGFSDVTSLHLSILHYSGLRTFYGPAITTSFGEWPDPIEETTASFLEAVTSTDADSRRLSPPSWWSNHSRPWTTSAWKEEPRKKEPNPGWKCLRAGEATAPMVIANLNTLMAAAGTPYFPNLEGKILVIEEMDAPLSKEERSIRQLELMGVFQVIRGLVIGKPEFYKDEGAPFGMDELVMEIAGKSGKFPIVSGFDCSHTHPMLTLAEMTEASLTGREGYNVGIALNEAMVE
jgi:muramoyltetrapeptide carboxypeptidase